MGLLSAVTTAGRITRALAAATHEGHRLAAASRAARARLHLPHPRIHHTRALVDFPGFAEGDTLAIVDGSEVFGFDDVTGSVTVEQLDPQVVRLAVDGNIGSLGRTFDVELRQLTDTDAEFTIGGFGLDEPFLVQVTRSGKRRLEVLPHGATAPVTLTGTRGGRLRLEFSLGDAPNVIVAQRA